MPSEPEEQPKPFKFEREPIAPPMRWGRIPEGEKCTYCEDAKIVDCPSCMFANGVLYSVTVLVN